MSLHLDAEDQKRLKAAFDALVCPLNASDLDAWRARVNRSLKALLDADMATFILPNDESGAAFGDELPPSTLKSYPSRYQRFAKSLGVWDRLPRLGVATRANLFAPRLDAYYRSSFYEYVRSQNGFDSLNAACWLEYDHDRQAILLLNRYSRKFGQRESSLLQLLYPAYRAGISTFERHRRWRSSFARTLDATGQALELRSLDGSVVHRTPALTALLRRDPQAGQLRTEMNWAAQAPFRADRRPEEFAENLDHRNVFREVFTDQTRYRIRASIVDAPLACGKPLVMVAVDRLTPEFPTRGALRDRFGLTPRQAEITLELATGRTTREIADALDISIHTARSHVEAALEKLGVHSRAEVLATILSGRLGLSTQ